VIRATIVLLAAHIVVPRLRRCSAAERHLLWAASMATAAVLPVLAVVMPAWRLPWPTRLVEAWPSALVALPWWASPGSSDVVIRPTGIESGTWAPLDWVGWLWILGALVAFLRLAVEVVKLRRFLRQARPATDARLLRLVSEVACALGLARAPTLLECPLAVIPMTWGVRASRVLLPAGSSGWSDERLRAVLAHELAHVRRADWLVHVLAEVTCAVYWFQPLFWTAQRALCRESEHAADDDAIGVGVEGSAYAADLLDIVRASRTPMPPQRGVVAMARTSYLERRVSALLNTAANRRSLSTRAVVIAAAMAIVVTLPLAAMTFERSAALPMDVVVRMLNLPAAMPGASLQGPDPARPAVRYVTSSDGTEGTSAIVAPTIAEYTTPALYSELARQRRIEGVITVAAHVDERGRMTRARVAKGLGFGLDQNALVAVRQWRFEAGTNQDKPAAMDTEIDIEFNLGTEAINELIANDMVTLVGPGVTPPRVARTTDRLSPVPGAHGAVVLDVVLLEDGSPKILRILQSLSPEADESAVRHFERWRFSPAMKNGVPVKVRLNAEVRFHGQDSKL